jgi:Zn finger protein HypA/HybF involved in hydrogenase expression
MRNAMPEPLSYLCKECLRSFRVVSFKKKDATPCPHCGGSAEVANDDLSSGMHVSGEKGKVSIILNGVVRKAGTYRCRVCAKDFTFDVSFGNVPACPRCRGDNCEATSPAATVFASSKLRTLREQKRTDYLCRTWKSLSELRAHKEVFRAFFEALDLSPEAKTSVMDSLNKAIDELDVQRKERVKQYDKVKS